ncbi:hypothetical protein IFM89_015009 [Coptis chinensis]|uniref:Uncharacterized protein n=1 Tax=Coptis chinensis TaxID=261450 RepID=A0A835HMD4_9MAGN|nr:hypothetical protein IFM89_015009 [Coptis chinensis]
MHCMQDMEMAVVDQSRAEARKESQGNVETWNESHPSCEQRPRSKKSKNVEPNIDTYVIFGEANIEDLSSQLPQLRSASRLPISPCYLQTRVITMARDDEDVDETRVEPKDVISDDAGRCVSRSKASKVKAMVILFRHHGANELREPFGAYSHG